MKKNKGGRPTAMTEETVRKLEQAFSNGATDLEACSYAGIAKQTLYEYQKKTPAFKDRKESLKSNLALISKNQVAKSIRDGNVTDAKWYLERKCKDEFGLKTESHVTGNVTVEVVSFTDAPQTSE